ncbi:CHASE3 domain-containing protein [Actinomycetospora cinnamomea]|uniref:CHASE3 domain-containing protein n=1 Tax=Actinomycetospora cinnamomea TaxID=663609 RepID=UPI001402844B|nr:CHASE3 domain-containing protein [Actinomycetospora cinnamomea]
MTVWSLVTVLVGIVVLTALVTGMARMRVAAGVTELAGELMPTQRETRALTIASVDQETGQRGYLLLGDPAFLAPYVSGREAEARAAAALTTLLRADPAAGADLAAATAAAAAWRTEVAEPNIAARRAGPLPTERVAASERRGKELFDVLRQRLAALQERTASRERGALAAIDAAQRTANVVALGAVVLAFGVAVASVPLMRRRMVRPLVGLQAQAERTADGAYQTPIAVTGPRDLVAIGDAVETMRTSLLRHGAELTDARLELALRDARDRLAAEVHDNSIQRLFALGLALQAAAARHPAAEGDLAPLVDETDAIVRELRELIAGLVRTEVSAATLRGQVFDLVRDCGRALGITPALEIRGPLEEAVTDEAARELLAALREALGNVARHARAPSAAVRLAVDEARVVLAVEDDGVGVPSDLAPGEGLAVVAARVERLGGTLAVTPRPTGGTLVSWQLPRTRDATPTPDPADTARTRP